MDANDTAVIVGYPAGRRMHTGSRRAEAKVFTQDGSVVSLRNNEESGTHSQDIIDVAGSGDYVITGSLEGRAKIWHSGQISRTLDHPHINHVDIRNDGAALTSDRNGSKFWPPGKTVEPITIPGYGAVFFDAKILTIAVGGKKLLVLEDTGNLTMTEIPLGKEYLLTNIIARGNYTLLAYKDSKIEVRDKDFKVLATNSGSGGAISENGILATINPSGIQFYSLREAKTLGHISWKQAKSVAFTGGSDHFLIVDREKLVSLTLDFEKYPENFRYVFYEDYSSLIAAERKFLGNILHLGVLKNGVTADYTGSAEEEQMEDKNGQIKAAIANSLKRRATQ
jgi:hypothetical protein